MKTLVLRLPPIHIERVGDAYRARIDGIPAGDLDFTPLGAVVALLRDLDLLWSDYEHSTIPVERRRPEDREMHARLQSLMTEE